MFSFKLIGNHVQAIAKVFIVLHCFTDLSEDGADSSSQEPKYEEKTYDCVICNQSSPSTIERPMGLVVLLQATSGTFSLDMSFLTPVWQNITYFSGPLFFEPCRLLEVDLHYFLLNNPFEMYAGFMTAMPVGYLSRVKFLLTIVFPDSWSFLHVK